MGRAWATRAQEPNRGRDALASLDWRGREEAAAGIRRRCWASGIGRASSTTVIAPPPAEGREDSQSCVLAIRRVGGDPTKIRAPGRLRGRLRREELAGGMALG